jgi:hypothetical protein
MVTLDTTFGASFFSQREKEEISSSGRDGRFGSYYLLPASPISFSISSKEDSTD